MSPLATALNALSVQVAELETERDELRRALAELRSEQRIDPAPAPSSYLTVNEAAEIVRCTHVTIRRAIRDGHLAAHGATNRMLLKEADLHAWVQSCPAVPR